MPPWRTSTWVASTSADAALGDRDVGRLGEVEAAVRDRDVLRDRRAGGAGGGRRRDPRCRVGLGRLGGNRGMAAGAPSRRACRPPSSGRASPSAWGSSARRRLRRWARRSVGSVMALAYRARRSNRHRREAAGGSCATFRVVRYPPSSRGPDPTHPVGSDERGARARRSDGVETEYQGRRDRRRGDLGRGHRPRRDDARQPGPEPEPVPDRPGQPAGTRPTAAPSAPPTPTAEPTASPIADPRPDPDARARPRSSSRRR